MSRKVKFAKLHDNITLHVPGIGALDKAFPQPSKSLVDLNMEVEGDEVHISFKLKGLPKFLIIPKANFVVFEAIPEPKAPKEAKK